MLGHIAQRLLFMSRLPQSNYGTPVAPNTGATLNFVEVPVKDQNMFAYGVATADNQGYATRLDFPSDQWILSHDASRPIEYDLDSATVGRMLYAAFGSVATSQPDAVGSPTVYRHIFTPQVASVSRQLPAYTLGEQVKPIIDSLFPSCVAEVFSLRGQGLSRITAAMTFRGSGKRTAPSGVVDATDNTNNIAKATGLQYLYNTQVELTIRDAGTLANSAPYGATKRLESWGFDYNNNPLADVGYRPGSGDYQTAGDRTSGSIRSELLFGDRAVGCNFVARMDTASDEYAALQAQRPLDVLIELTGALISGSYYHKLSIRLYLTRYQTVDLGNSAGIVTLAIRPKPLYSVSDGKIVQVTLDNTTPSYVT